MEEMYCIECHGRGLDSEDKLCHRCGGTGYEPEFEPVDDTCGPEVSAFNQVSVTRFPESAGVARSA